MARRSATRRLIVTIMPLPPAMRMFCRLKD
jgi:hypothetical protein